MSKPIKLKNGLYAIRINYTDMGGEYRRMYRSGFKSARDALRWEQETTKVLSNANDAHITLYEIIDEILYIKEYVKKVSLNTLSSYKQYFKYLKNDINNIEINKINSKVIQQAINKNAKYPRKCYFYKQLLSMIDKYSLKKRYILHSFLDDIIFPTYKPQKRKFLYDEELSQLLKYCKSSSAFDVIYTPLFLCAQFGLRPSEALGITNDDVTPVILSINKAVTLIGNEQVIHPPKTESSYRQFEIDNSIYKEIYYFKNKYNIKSDFVCCNRKGKLILLRYFSYKLDELIKDYNNNHPECTIPHVTPYSFRHSFGNIQKRIGTDIYTISQTMGHSSTVTTSKNYFQNDKILSKNAINKLTKKLKI